MDDFRKIFYGVLVGFVVVIVAWISYIALSAAPVLQGERTPVPSLIAETLPAQVSFPVATATATSAPTTETVTPPPESDIARPSNPGGPGQAVNLTGDATSGEQLFLTHCVACHGLQGAAGISNPGSVDGSVPVLNPIDPTIVDPNYSTFATNIDLFIQNGSTPLGLSPVVTMPAWGSLNKLTQQEIADIIAYIISLNTGTPIPTATP